MKQYKVLEMEVLTDNTFKIRSERPDNDITAGQCFNVGVPGTSINREYSMYSGAMDPYLDFLIKEVKGGNVSTELRKLKPGDLIEIDGPYGEFCLKEPHREGQKYVFIGTGTGIAPFHSYTRTYDNLDYVIMHGIRHESEQFHRADYGEGRYIPCISRNSSGKSWRVTDFLRENPIDESSIVYLCGNRNMIVDTFEILINQGIPGNNLFTEVFF